MKRVLLRCQVAWLLAASMFYTQSVVAQEQSGKVKECSNATLQIALEDAGVISSLERRALEEWLNSGELHRSQAADGSAVVCLDSLLARMQNTKPS